MLVRAGHLPLMALASLVILLARLVLGHLLLIVPPVLRILLFIQADIVDQSADQENTNLMEFA